MDKAELLAAQTTVTCPACGATAVLDEVVPQSARGPRLEFFSCKATGCTGGKLAVVFEVSETLVAPDPSYVEAEVARRGAFFPSDGRPPGVGRGRPW